VTGTVTGYAVSPVLPAGLRINTTSGVISGTPTAVAAMAVYTITASNAAGSTTATVSIVVNSGAPSIAYGSSYYSFTKGITAQAITPTNTGLAADSWSVDPALPAGLSLSATTGSISGTPTGSAAAAPYVVTAANAAGQSTESLTIAISAAPLFDLGHAASVQLLRFVNSSALSQDPTGHWVLWNFTTAQELASGNSPVVYNPVTAETLPLPVDLKGTTVAIQTATGFELRSASSGQVLVEIAATTPAWWSLASDGSYICAGSSSGITVWSTAGAVLASLSGDYSKAIVFAAPGQVQIALGASGINVIQTAAVPGGASTVSPSFHGTFQSWFTDGGRFLTSTGSAVWVYSNTAVQQDLASVPTGATLAGEGNWYWTFGSNATLTLYAVGSAGTPTSSYPLGSPGAAIGSGTTVALIGTQVSGMSYVGTFAVLDLSGATPVTTSYTMPIQGMTSYAANSAATFIAGIGGGALVDGSTLSTQPRYLGYGAAVSISGSSTNVVVATASGQILYFDAATGALQGSVTHPSSNVMVSSDGTVFAAAGPAVSSYLYGSFYFPFATDRSVTTFSLPGGTVITTFPYSSTSTPLLLSMTLSGSGTVVGEILSSASPCIAQAVPATGGGALWCDTSTTDDIAQLQLSPNGTLIATSPPAPSSDITGPADSTTNIYLNGTLSTAVTGWVVGWIDNNALLINNYSYDSNMTMENLYTGASIYNATGQMIGSSTLPELGAIQAVSSSLVYSPQRNAIYSLTSGAATWSSGSPLNNETTGAVSGSNVVFSSGNFVLAEPY
jgi:hypothetical protein